MLYLIFGEERFLMDKKINELKERFPITEPDLNITTIDCREQPLTAVIEECQAVPFFSDYRMVILKQPYFFTSEKAAKVDESLLKQLVELLIQDNNENIYILFYEGKFDDRKALVKKLKKAGQSIDCRHLDERESFNHAKLAFKKRQVEVDDDALHLFSTYAYGDLLKMHQDIEKIALYKKHITIEDMALLIDRPIEDNVFTLSNALLKKDLKQVLSIYQDLKERKSEPIALIAMLSNSLRLLYQVTLLDRKGYNDGEIAKYLGLNPYRLKYIRKDSRSYDLNDILELLKALSSLDLAIKEGRIDKYLGLELFFLKLV